MDDVLNYCLFCLSNSEEKIMKSLRDMGCEPMSPKVKKVVPGKPQAKVKRLMPGYVFFSAEKEPDWHEVRRIPDVLRVLGYENGEYGKQLRLRAKRQ